MIDYNRCQYETWKVLQTAFQMGFNAAMQKMLAISQEDLRLLYDEISNYNPDAISINILSFFPTETIMAEIAKREKEARV